MADFSITNERVFPSVNDVAESGGSTKKGTEQNWSELSGTVHDASYVQSGLDFTDNANLIPTIGTGVAFFEGYRVELTDTVDITLTGSSTNYVFLKLNRDGNDNVTDAEIEVNITGTPPADSIKLHEFTTNVSTITSDTDYRDLSSHSIEQLERGEDSDEDTSTSTTHTVDLTFNDVQVGDRILINWHATTNQNVNSVAINKQSGTADYEAFHNRSSSSFNLFAFDESTSAADHPTISGFVILKVTTSGSMVVRLTAIYNTGTAHALEAYGLALRGDK